jgi:starch-binding outer membrane protein, SusD/RagB family
MKSIFLKSLFTAVIVVFSFNACDISRLDSPPLGLTEESYFTLQSEYEQALYNAYAKMTDWYWFRAQSFLQPMYFLPGDDITEENGVYGTWEIFNNINPTDGRISYFWRATYELIQRTNVVIEKTSQADPTQFDDPSFLDIHRGEALFLRALANFKLYNMFGTAPVVTERLNVETLHQPKSEGTKLLDQAIEDLQTAIPLLPVSWDDSQRGRATKNSANGLLLKALVFRGDYTGNTADYAAAIPAYNNITASLTDNYLDNFSAFTENNEESLFEFQASRAPGQDNVWLQNDGPWRGVEVMSTYWGFYTVVSNESRNNLPGNTWKVTQKMVDAYGADPRVDTLTEANRAFTKYGKLGLDELSGTVGSLNNVRILRYAESKLLAAEAILLSGGSKSEAITLINEVRKRARDWSGGSEPADRNTAETDAATIMQWIEDERAIELLGEEQIRWFDLKRWDARGYKDLSTWGGDDQGFSTDLSGNFQFEYPKHLLLPIPQSEVNANEAITENNPGY